MLPSLKQMQRASDGNYWRRTTHCVKLLALLIQASSFVSHRDCNRTELPLSAISISSVFSTLFPNGTILAVAKGFNTLDLWQQLPQSCIVATEVIILNEQKKAT